MKSSKLHTSHWERTVRVRDCGIRLVRKMSAPHVRSEGEESAKRGEIRGFSSDARLRLRDALSSMYVPGAFVLGVTLTVPWRDLDEESAALLYARLWHDFSERFRRSFPGSGAIFRHELQRRRMPHTHMVLYLVGFDVDFFRLRVSSMWCSCLDYVGYYGGSRSSASAYAVRVDVVSGDSACLFRYLADHTSKSKQAQLGFSGKQWGYLNRRVFVRRLESLYRFPDDASLVCFTRAVSRLCRFFVPVPLSSKRHHFKAFPFKKSPCRRLGSVSFLTPASSIRLAAYYGGENIVFDDGLREFIVRC